MEIIWFPALMTESHPVSGQLLQCWKLFLLILCNYILHHLTPPTVLRGVAMMTTLYTQLENRKHLGGLKLDLTITCPSSTTASCDSFCADRMISAWRCWQTGSSSLVIIEVIVNARNDDADAPELNYDRGESW